MASLMCDGVDGGKFWIGGAGSYWFDVTFACVWRVQVVKLVTRFHTNLQLLGNDVEKYSWRKRQIFNREELWDNGFHTTNHIHGKCKRNSQPILVTPLFCSIKFKDPTKAQVKWEFHILEAVRYLQSSFYDLEDLRFENRNLSRNLRIPMYRGRKVWALEDLYSSMQLRIGNIGSNKAQKKEI